MGALTAFYIIIYLLTNRKFEILDTFKCVNIQELWKSSSLIIQCDNFSKPKKYI